MVRDACLADAAKIAHLLGQLGYPSTAQCVERKLLYQLGRTDAFLLVATEDTGSVIGFVSGHFIPQIALEGDFCRISYFCVDQHSRSLGVGRLLEESVSAIANRRNCDRIEVHCHARRELAHRFYFKQGYIESPKYLLKKVSAS